MKLPENWRHNFRDGSVPVLTGIGGLPVLGLPGGVMGVGDQWLGPSWRGARQTDPVDPWATLTAVSGAIPESATPTGTVPTGTAPTGSVPTPTGSVLGGFLPVGVGLSVSGGVSVFGLEWLDARVYDSVSRGFLSVDPWEPVTGAGWAGNPYSYAGNDPLNMVDPLGLRPATDADLKAYAGARQGALAAAGEWVGQNWEYLAGGAMVVAGGVLMATGVGGPVGLMLIAAGADTIIQKATSGQVNWGQVALSGALGGFGGAAVAAKAGFTGVKAAVVAGASSGATSGGVMNTYSYYTAPGPHDVLGGLAAAGIGAGSGALLGGAGGRAGQWVSGKIMNPLTYNPQATTMAMGRIMKERVKPYAVENGYGYYKAMPDSFYEMGGKLVGEARNDRLNIWINKKWINYQMMQGKGLVDIGTPNPLWGNPDNPFKASPYYRMETREVWGYSKYSADFQSSWDLRPNSGG